LTCPFPVQLFTPPFECILMNPTTSEALKIEAPVLSLNERKNAMLLVKSVVLLKLFRVKLTCPFKQPGVLLMRHIMSGHLPCTRPYFSSMGIAPKVPGLAARLNLCREVIAMRTE